MKTFKKVEINASTLSKAEMKNISGGNYGGYLCTTHTTESETAYNMKCSTDSGSSCMTDNGEIGNCSMSYSFGGGIKCFCVGQPM